RSVPIKADWEVDIDNLIKGCDENTGLLFIANPNNPTGLLISQNEIKRLLENIPASTILVLDEAYYEYAAKQLTCNSISWLDEHPNLLITRTFSKIYGMAGLRLGYAIANPEIISLLQRVQLPFAVNQLALTAAHAAIDDSDFIARSLKNNAAGMQQMQEGFQQLNLEFIDSSCNFLTFDCKEDSSKLYNFLLDRGIIVRPLHPYQMPNYIRVTIGTPEQNTRFLNALKEYY
ncbi:MAG: aminotransferase class I/II-fold pyridoxal phosphate-dependent enzyme, partial [Legionella sp.]